MLSQLERDYRGSGGEITTESFDYQKERLEAELERMRGEESQRKKDESAGTYGSQISAAMKSPLAKYLEQIAEIDKRTDPIFGGPGSDFLNAEQARFAKLQAQKTYLESLDSPQDRGPERAGALERGSAAAFSASFGSKAIDKTQTEMLRVEREIRDILKRNSTQVVTIGA